MAYGWIITKDKIATDGYDAPSNVNAVGMTGPRDLDRNIYVKLKAGGGTKFRMRDGDGEIYYYGKYLGDMSEDGFAPLDDFGMPNAGCTDIEYYENGKWEYL